MTTTYSKEALKAAHIAWQQLNKAFGEQITEFESTDEFEIFYSAVIERLYDTEEDIT